jgi:transcriptional regulator GlxA family with amidase domain
MDKTNVAVLLFEDVEVLDFAGPFEVFSRVRTLPGLESRWNEDTAPFNVFTVAKTAEPISAIANMMVIPDHGFETAPRIDILVVPGGLGARALLDDEETLTWIKSVDESTSLTTSVCTGSLVLAKAGLLAGRTATSHWGALEALGQIDQSITVDKTSRFVDDGIMTSAGVSAGIDMSLHIVEQRCGVDVANDTARFMDYPRAQAAA